MPPRCTMPVIGKILKDLVENIVTFVVMFVLAIVGFYLTVFVVDTASALAGLSPGADFIILSATLLVIAAILGGGRVPLGVVVSDERDDDGDPDTAYV